MASSTQITKIKFINSSKQKGVVFFSLNDVQKLFGLKNKNTIKHLVIRAVKENIVKRLIKNKYLFLHGNKSPSDFCTANYLIAPSYVSLESALSFYGMITQFPYRITSVALTKSRSIMIGEKEFTYSKIKKEYFKDYVKIDDFLIATKEKALFDYYYFIYKGLRPKNTTEELSIFLKEAIIRNYFAKNADQLFINFLKKYVKL
jgi:predicted transcriptional regulator of viral defense system